MLVSHDRAGVPHQLPGGTTVTEELEDYLRQIDAVKRDSRTVASGLSQAQLNWRPGEGRWSIAECLVHLNVVVTKTLPAFDRAIERGERLRTTTFRCTRH